MTGSGVAVYRPVRLVGSGCRLLVLRAGEAVTTHNPRGWPGPARVDGVPPLLDLSFDSGTLHTARARIRDCASRAGFGEDQAEDVVLAVHELTANVIRHASGAGRLRAWSLAGMLHCQVDDGVASGFAVNSLPCEPGHGLWVVRQVASQMQTLSGPAGTSVQVRFDRAGQREQEDAQRLATWEHGAPSSPARPR